MITRSKLTQFAWAILTIAFLASIFPFAAAAQDDPPGRVARIGYLRGNVSFNPAGTDDWVGAVLNRPVTIGDKLWSDQDSLAELHLGPAAIRLGSNTAFTILNLDDYNTQLSVNEGVINIHLRRLNPDDSFEVDTPNSAFTIQRPGDYRLQVSADGDYTLITDRNGEGEITGGGQDFTIYSNQSAELDGTDEISANLYDAYPPDDFDNWCVERNRREDDVPRWVSPDMVGYEDLNESGQWRQVPDYGAMWVPNGMAGDWAPYRYGHWVWVSPWGWTWIDDAPWGFAPFHYGRWVQYGGAWGWLPGPVVAVRPVYAPALVAWVGGPGAGIGVGVAWFPLGPREVFVPPYAVSERYVTNLNVTSTNVTNVQVTNVYREVVVNKTVVNVTYVNRTYVTATSQQAFTGGQPVGRNIVKVDAQTIARAPVGTAAGAGVAPQAHSFAGAAATSGNFKRPPAAAVSRQVVAKKTPPPPPVSFAAQQKAIASNGGKPVPVAQLKAMQPAAAAKPAVRVAPPAAKTPPPTKSASRPPQPAPGAKPANMPAARPANAPPANAARPPAAPENKPAEKPAEKPAPPPANPNRPPAANPENRPAPKPEAQPKPEPNKPAPPPAKPAPPANKPPAAQPENKPAPKTEPNKPAPQNQKDDKNKKEKPKDEKDKDKPQGM
jgi:hypothetical protein